MWSLIQTVPNWSLRAAFSARPRSLVQTEDASPYGDVVRPVDRLVVVGEALDGDDGAEDLALDDLVRLLDVREHGRVHEEAAVAVRAAAREDGRALGAVEEPEHAVLLILGDDRAHLDVLALGRVADLDRLDGRNELLQELVVDLGAGDDPRGGGAVLPRVPVAGDLDALGHGGRVGVVEDDHGRLAAELEVDALERVGGGLRR